MESSFELKEADLFEVQRHRFVLRRRALRSPVGLAVVTLVVGIIGWPIGRAILEPVPGGALPWWTGCIVTVAAMLIAGRKQFERVRLPALQNWALNRAVKAAMKRSVVGRITVVLTQNSIKRLREGDVKRLTVSKTVLMLQLSLRRVLVVPRRAFANDAEADAFQQRVEALTAKTATVIGDDE